MLGFPPQRIFNISFNPTYGLTIPHLDSPLMLFPRLSEKLVFSGQMSMLSPYGISATVKSIIRSVPSVSRDSGVKKSTMDIFISRSG